MLIVMMASRGENHELHIEVNPKYVNGDNVKKALNALDIRYLEHAEHNEFKSRGDDGMRPLSVFLSWTIACLEKSLRR